MKMSKKMKRSILIELCTQNVEANKITGISPILKRPSAQRSQNFRKTLTKSKSYLETSGIKSSLNELEQLGTL